MAKVTVKRDIKVLLELEEEEAACLLGLTQNYMGDKPIESIEEEEAREAIYTALIGFKSLRASN